MFTFNALEKASGKWINVNAIPVAQPDHGAISTTEVKMMSSGRTYLELICATPIADYPMVQQLRVPFATETKAPNLRNATIWVIRVWLLDNLDAVLERSVFSRPYFSILSEVYVSI